MSDIWFTRCKWHLNETIKANWHNNCDSQGDEISCQWKCLARQYGSWSVAQIACHWGRHLVCKNVEHQLEPLCSPLRLKGVNSFHGIHKNIKKSKMSFIETLVTCANLSLPKKDGPLRAVHIALIEGLWEAVIL